VNNAQASLLATALNNVGVGSFLAGVVAPQNSNNGYEARWFGFAVLAQITAQLLLAE